MLLARLLSGLGHALTRREYDALMRQPPLNPPAPCPCLRWQWSAWHWTYFAPCAKRCGGTGELRG